MRHEEEPEINLFMPRRGFMRSGVLVIIFILIGWGGMTFGFQILLAVLGEPPLADSVLTRFTFFDLPFHFWFTGQFLPLWFIILCFLFNTYMDRLEERNSRRREFDDDWQ